MMAPSLLRRLLKVVSDLKAQVPEHVVWRHAPIIVRYGTPLKVHNAASACLSYLRERTDIPSKPLFLKVELSRHCTVNCLHCTDIKAERYFPSARFFELVEECKRQLFMVQLYEVGEPLFHPDILECIRFAHERRIATVISSSLSLHKPVEFWRELVQSGLDLLIVAIDGLYKESYQKYRQNGDFDLVMENLMAILAHRKQARSAMRVEWQMIDLPWNEAEQAAAREKAFEMGCDNFRLIPEAFLARKGYEISPIRRERHCLWPYLLFLVDAYGSVVPCFKPDCHPGIVGDLVRESVEEVWNGAPMQRFRGRRTLTTLQGCATCRE